MEARNRASSRKSVACLVPVSSNTSRCFTPGLVSYSRAMDMEEQEHLSGKDFSEDDYSSLQCRCKGANLHGVEAVGWDWKSGNWTDRGQFLHDSHHHELDDQKHCKEGVVDDDSIEGRISRLRRHAGRMVTEHRLAACQLHQPGWVSDLESITERRRRDVYGSSELETRIRREKAGSRSRRRASYHVMDMQGRRKFTRREYQVRREVGTRRNLSSVGIGRDIVSSLQLLGETLHVSKAFSLETLEEYLKERAAARRVHDVEVSTVVGAEANPSQLASFTAVKYLEQSARVARRRGWQKDILVDRHHQSPISVCESDNGQDEDSDGQRSGCGISWRWLNSHQAKDDSAMPSCLPSVSKRRIGRRLLVSRHRKGGEWGKYNSEGSFTSFDSDSEAVPLMTEPEPFNDYTTDDVAGSSVELERGPRSRFKELKPTKASRFKEDRRSRSNSHSFRKSDYEMECNELGFPVVRKGRQPVVERYRSLSQKHRPKNFKDLVGQPMVAQSLSNAVLMGKIAPVYLFQGPRGSGKTSAARIFSAALNCLSAEELRPCGTCTYCTSLYAGKNFDVREVDAASSNGIESMKLLLKHISLPPTSRFKVFIIDECHSLTTEAWNAFLKSLEEPPSYVVFILITTDAEQVPRTALSRCQKFLFLKVKDVDIVSRLQNISFLESINVEHEALQLIASRSDGSMREAEMTLDQVGLISEKKLIEFLEVALSPDMTSTVKCIRDLMEAGVEPLALISQLAALITDIMAGNNRSAAYRLKHVRKIEDERFRQALKILSEAEKQLRTCTQKTTWLTATFLQFSQPDSSNNLPPSSLGTSVTQSPVNFFDTSEKETVEGDSHSPQKVEYFERAERGGHRQVDSRNLSGPCSGINKVHSSNQSPRSQADADDTRTASGATRPPAIPRALSDGTKKSDWKEASYAMDDIWRKVLDNSSSAVVKELLYNEAKLVSLSVTEVLATVHLEFKHLEHKIMAERARASIADALEEAMGCAVDINVALSAHDSQDTAFEQQSRQRRLGEETSIQEHPRRSRSSSFRMSSSSSKFGVAVGSSPRIRLSEPRKRRQSSELDDPTCILRPSIALSEGARSRTIMLSHHQLESDAMENRRSSIHYEPRMSRTFSQGQSTDTQGFRDSNDAPDQCLAECRERNIDTAENFSPVLGNRDVYGVGADKDSSDAEVEEGYGSGLLCWKGSRINDGKGKHQRLRRKRKGRLLLRLVPCANGDGRH